MRMEENSVCFSPMPYAAILFDMDGTLLETSPLWSKATRIALAEHNIEFTEEEHFSLGGTLLEHMLAEKGYAPDIITSVYHARDTALLPVMEAEAVWVSGAPELMDALSVPKGIITSSHRNIFGGINRKLNLEALFDVIIIAEDVMPDYKPHPKGLLLACERLNVAPSSCVYIGDQLCDLDAAKNAGMDSILIRGTHTPKDLTHEKMAESFAELTQLLA
jgi:HAD superfamily hydrolase (TIGR01509 family)